MFLDIPTIPFSVYYKEYNKTVYVVASCNEDDWNSKTLEFTSHEGLNYELIFKEVNNAFDTPGLTRIQLCRKDK